MIKLTRSEIARKAGKASMKKLTAKQRKLKASNAAKALWVKIRAGNFTDY